MTMSIDRSICCDLNETVQREWLVTNGSGGYAAGTVAGVLTRQQHGMLVATMPQTETPFLMIAKIDEEIFFDQRTYYLGTNEYRDGTINPAGFVHLEAFRLEHGFPVFTYRLGGVDGLFLEKRIWMSSGQNTTFIQYRAFRTTTSARSGYRRSGITGAVSAFEHYPEQLAALRQTQQSITLTLLPFTGYRPFNQSQYGDNQHHYQVESHHTDEERNVYSPSQIPLPRGVSGCTIRANARALPYHIFAIGHPSSHTSFIPTGVWYWNFLHRYSIPTNSTDDFYLPGVIRTTLWPEEEATFTLLLSCEDPTTLPLTRARIQRDYQEQINQQQQMLQKVLDQPEYYSILPLPTNQPYEDGRTCFAHLLQASHHFLLRQHIPPSANTDEDFLPSSVITIPSHFYSLENKTRNTLIALPGLLLVTQRYGIARQILRRLSQHFLYGLIPDRLPTSQQPLQEIDYGSADTTLWYFYALDYYLRATHDDDLLEEVFPKLRDCIQRYVQGTNKKASLDPNDALLTIPQGQQPLTWMNATLDNRPVTPRTGKPVELNALWYHALLLMEQWTLHLRHMGMFGQNSTYYRELHQRCQQSFNQRYWYQEKGYLYDVIDGPEGNDVSLRPNQLFAISLRYRVLCPDYYQDILNVVKDHLLTPHGLRTLAPDHPGYKAQFGLNDQEVALALHQGSIHPWLIGPYIDAIAHNSMIRSPSKETNSEMFRKQAIQLIENVYKRFSSGLLGNCEGVLHASGKGSSTPGTMLASAMSIGELLRCYHLLAHYPVDTPEHVLSYREM